MMRLGTLLPQAFYERDPGEVAASLVGKLLVRARGRSAIVGVIVETEAYYAAWDPASRASRGGSLSRAMRWNPGTALVYGVHGNWLFNIVAHRPGEAGAVLLRALKTRVGDAGGPGRLSRLLGIDKTLHGKPVYTRRHGLWLEDVGLKPPVSRGKRIGVSVDLPVPLRFYSLSLPEPMSVLEGAQQP